MDKENRLVLELLKLILQNYGEMYLKGRLENYTIRRFHLLIKNRTKVVFIFHRSGYSFKK